MEARETVRTVNSARRENTASRGAALPGNLREVQTRRIWTLTGNLTCFPTNAVMVPRHDLRSSLSDGRLALSCSVQ